jgi:hypothetical protein
MRHHRLWFYVIAAAAIMFLVINDVVARGGVERGGGGWSGGGRGGGGYSRGGGAAPGGGRGSTERSFEHADRVRPDNLPDYHPDRHPDHRPDWPDRPDRNATVTKNVNVNVPDDGWYRYGAADEALAGMMMITAMGAVSAANSSDSNTVIIEQPQAPAAPQQPAIPSIGAQVLALPEGCQGRNIEGTLYYQSGSAWYRPYFGASGVYYQVVEPPAGVNVAK